MKMNFQGGASVPASRGEHFQKSAREDARPAKFFLPFLAAMIFFAVGARAETTNDLSDAEIQGRKLVQQLLAQSPATNSAQDFTLQVRDSKKRRFEMPVLFDTLVTPTNWISLYQSLSFSNYCSLVVCHAGDKPNQYFYFYKTNPLKTNTIIVTNETAIAFAGSDFWVADLGLEFFHWPEQKILKKEVKRSRGCAVLESKNPNPSTNGYSRVVSWIDDESGGIVHAEAYDFKNKLLKEFDPKSFKKVNGQWQLQEMEIRNVQTGSRTRLEFVDLGLGTTNSVDATSGLPQK
jgi:Outer membrane lipoprotein-sorting protein